MERDVREREKSGFSAALTVGRQLDLNLPDSRAVRDAYEKLSVEDSWLILLTDASAGIHRPEARWDDEKLIVA